MRDVSTEKRKLKQIISCDKFVIFTEILDTYAILYNSKTTIYADKVKQPFHELKLHIRSLGGICDFVCVKALAFEKKSKYEPIIWSL